MIFFRAHVTPPLGARHLLHAATLAMALSGPAAIAASVNASPLLPGTDDGRKLFEKYCYECHGDGATKGKLALDDLLAKLPGQDDHPRWEKAWKIVRHEFMPPADADQPSNAERKAITQWIEQHALGIDYAKSDPGRVTIRRLNRMEYEYSVTDLFGASFTSPQHNASDTKDGENTADAQLRDKIPPDDTAFGFDNNGDFMSLSPALLEKFFNLAEWIASQAIVQDGPPHPVLQLSKLGLKSAVAPDTRRAEQSGAFEARYSGRHRLDLEFTAGDFSELAGTFDLSILVDGNEVVHDELLIGGHKTYKYAPEFTLEKGAHTWAFVTRPSKPDSINKPVHRGRANALQPHLYARLTGPIGTGIYEYPETHRRVFFQGDPPSAPVARRAYAKAIVQRVADRAFRRPTDDVSLERLTEIVMRNESFERGVGQALTAILASPRFLFRLEQQPSPDDPKAIHPIDDFALASRLSQMLWLSLPDAELMQLAAAGQVRQNLAAQLRRMLADPKSARFFEDFPGQWLRTRNVLMTSNARDRGALDPVRAAMKRETEMLFEDIVRNDRDVMQLITANYTFVNQKLADFYGIKGVKLDGFQRVELSPESHRGGILTHGSFLVSTSNPNRTSPVKRGLFVLENLWATEPPPPPPDIPALDEATVGGSTPKTVREQLAVHREQKSCAACHAHFDPIGLVLENYDLIGRWREQEGGVKIEPHETMVSGETLSGVDDLRRSFAARPERFYRGVTEKLLVYSLGRGLEPFDAAAVDRIVDRVMADGGRFFTLLLGVVESPAFQMRRGDDGAALAAPRSIIPPTPSTEQLAEIRRGAKTRRPANAKLADDQPADAEKEAP